MTAFAEIGLQELTARIEGLPQDAPVHMLQLLRFHDDAQYGVYSAHQRCTGREAYFARYIPALQELMPAVGASEVAFAGPVLAALAGEAGPDWQGVGLIRCPSLRAFGDLIRSPLYLELVEPHRAAALADWRLYMVEPAG